MKFTLEKIMSKRMSAELLVLLSMLVGPAALAHGGGEHVMGTVKSIEASTITVETKDHKEVRVDTDASTDFEKSGEKVTLQDLKPGERVAIHAKKAAADGALKAEQVKFGKSKAKAQAPKP